MEIRDYVRVLRKQFRLILFAVLLVVAAAMALTIRATPQYQTDVRFFVSLANAGTGENAVALSAADFTVQLSLVSYAQVLSGPLTAESIAAAEPGLPADVVSGRISAQPVDGTVLLDATVTDTDAQRAFEIAQALSEAFPDVIAELERRPGSAEAPVNITTVNEPSLPTAPISPNPTRNLLIALGLGLFLGAAVAIVREALDNTVKTQDDVRDVTGASTLGVIGFDSSASRKPLIVQDSPKSLRAEAFRQLRTNLQFVGVDGDARSLTITSSLPKEGKSTLACNLAIVLAQAGVRVCLVEGDLRRPRVADYLGIESAVGVTNVLIDTASLDDVLQPWGDLPLTVLASGPIPPNPAELLASRHMAELLDELERRFDYVIIDAPPLLPVTDAAVIARITDGALLVVRCRSTRTDQLRQAAAALTSVDARVLGAVINMVPKGGGDAYGYGYGYGYASYKTDKRKRKLSAEDEQRATQAVSRGTSRPSTPASAPAPEAAPARQAADEPSRTA